MGPTVALDQLRLELRDPLETTTSRENDGSTCALDLGVLLDNFLLLGVRSFLALVDGVVGLGQ